VVRSRKSILKIDSLLLSSSQPCSLRAGFQSKFGHCIPYIVLRPVFRFSRRHFFGRVANACLIREKSQ